MSEGFVVKAGGKEGSEACRCTSRTFFSDNADPRNLQPFAVNRGFGMASIYKESKGVIERLPPGEGRSLERRTVALNPFATLHIVFGKEGSMRRISGTQIAFAAVVLAGLVLSNMTVAETVSPAPPRDENNDWNPAILKVAASFK
jgi:hypothetical protein